jgi:hypothetical protein
MPQAAFPVLTQQAIIKKLLRLTQVYSIYINKKRSDKWLVVVPFASINKKYKYKNNQLFFCFYFEVIV